MAGFFSPFRRPQLSADPVLNLQRGVDRLFAMCSVRAAFQPAVSAA
jgi:hypothetical protein